MRQPPSFGTEHQGEWDLYVLEHGLPCIPRDLSVDEAVPVARWTSPTTAAVLHIGRRIGSSPGADPITYTDVDCFRLVEGAWESENSGGGGWKTTSPLTRVDVPPDSVEFYGAQTGGMCAALYGVIGSNAALAEVEQGSVATRHDLDAPVGAFVVCAVSDQPFAVRIFAADGRLLHERHQATD